MRAALNYFSSDIRCWIILFFVIRLYGITDPPLEAAHNWRQACGCMVARNFLEVDANIFYPRVDMAGEKTGITGTEFPALNYMIYLVSKVFGYTHWYGRLINLIVSSIGTYFFFLLVKKYFNPKAALYSTIVLLSSIWFAYSHKTMPDTFSVSIALVSLYSGMLYLERHQFKWLVVFFLTGALALLSKIPSAVILSAFLIPVFDGIYQSRSKVLFAITAVLVLSIAGTWYFHWVPYLVEKYGYWHYFMGTDLREGARALLANPFNTTEKIFFDAVKFVGFAVFLYGMYAIIRASDKLLIYISVVTVVIFALFMVKAGFNFTVHSYYVIPLVPFMALIIGWTISNLRSKTLQIFLLLAISAEGIGNHQHDFRIKETELYKMDLESIADSISNRDDLIAINAGSNPQQMYLAHRKGWIMSNEDFQNGETIDKIREKGCVFLFINLTEPSVVDYELPFNIVYEDEHYRILNIEVQ